MSIQELKELGYLLITCGLLTIPLCILAAIFECYMERRKK